MPNAKAVIGKTSRKVSKQGIPRLQLIVTALLIGTIGTYLLVFSKAAVSCTTTLSPGANVASAISSATAGSTICLNSGTYGNASLTGVNKSSDVTVQSVSGAGATIASSTLSSSSHIKFQSLTINGMGITGSSHDITVANSVFKDQLVINIPGSTDTNILIDSDTFNNINVATDDYEGRLHVLDGQGVQISNSQFSGGCSDGVRLDGPGVEVGPGNEFVNIVQGGCDPLHVDPLQIYGGNNSNIHDNYFHGNGTGIMSPDGGSNETITNNVFDSPGYPPLTLGSHHGDVITHNTSNGTFRIYEGNSGSNSSNNIVRDNIIGGFSLNSGALSVEDYNVVSGGSGAHDISGTPTYVGGAHPTTFAGWALALNSIGQDSGSDGKDRGANVSGGGTTTPPPPPAATTAPTVSITAPTSGATVSGSTTVTATASDNTGVSGVQFKLDGTNLGSEDTSTSYSATWNTTTATNGTHTLTAIARDAAGNTKTSSTVTVTVSNTTGGGGTQTSNCFPVPSACGYPDATNTGVPAGTTLTPSGSRTLTSGQTLNAVDLTGDVLVNGPNVTIQNSKLHTNGGGSGETVITLAQGATNFTLKDSEIYGNGSKTNAPESGVWNHYNNAGATVLRSYIHGSPDNWEGRVDSVKDSYMIVDANYSGAHSENIYLCGEQANVDHSTFFNEHDETSLIFGDGICGGGNPVSVTNSLLAGGGFMLEPNAKGVSAPVTITGNRVGRCLTASHQDSGGGYVCASGDDTHGYWPYGGHYGLTADLGNSVTWSGNVWDDNSQTICPTQTGAGSCSSTPPPSDTTAPTVSFSSPANGATVSGTVTATAAASDNTAVTKVEISLDGTLKMTDTSSPYNYSFDSKTLTNGSHTLTAKAYDAAGNTKTTTITVTVDNTDTTPPSAPTGLTATTPNSTTVNLSWNASTDSGTNATGVAKYNVLRGGVVIAQITGTSYSDTGRTASTSYSYVVQAVDGANNVSNNSNTATVSTPAPPTTPDTTPPTVPANLQAAAPSINQVNLTWNASTDTGGSGLAGYNVYRNGTKLNSSLITTTSYGDSTASEDTSYSYKVEAVDGSGNKSAQTSAVTIRTPMAKRGDITGVNGTPDGNIDLRDISYVIRNYNTTDPNADVSGPNGTPDGKVDLYDLSYMIRNYGK